MTETIWGAKEARRQILAKILALNKPARVFVLGPRNSGLEDLAEDLAYEAPLLRIVLRYHKPWSEVLQMYPIAKKTNRSTGKIAVFLQTPLQTDEYEPCDTEEEFVLSRTKSGDEVSTVRYLLRIAIEKE